MPNADFSAFTVIFETTGAAGASVLRQAARVTFLKEMIGF
jgi:hypothetical protein